MRLTPVRLALAARMIKPAVEPISAPAGEMPEPMKYKSVKKVHPKVTVPDLERSISRYLEHGSVETRENEEIGQERKMARDANWAHRFWLHGKLLSRLPLVVSATSACLLPKQQFASEEERLRYTALLIRGLVEFQDATDRKCYVGASDQTNRVMGCYRIPRVGCDSHHMRDKRNKGDEHVTLMRDNQAFIIHTRLNGKIIPAEGILRQLKMAVEAATPKKEEVMILPITAASSGGRDEAAECWEELLKNETNQQSLATVRESLFVVCLDNDEDAKIGATQKNADASLDYTEDSLVEAGKHLLIGDGTGKNKLNRWYDSSLQVIVRSNGVSGFCFEDSCTENKTKAEMIQSALRYVTKHKNNKLMFTPTPLSFAPSALPWIINEKAKKLMDSQVNTFEGVHENLKLEAMIFEDFGREEVERWNLSCDRFVQLAIELAMLRVGDPGEKQWSLGTDLRMSLNDRIQQLRREVNNEEMESDVTSTLGECFFFGQSSDTGDCAYNVMPNRIIFTFKPNEQTNVSALKIALFQVLREIQARLQC